MYKEWHTHFRYKDITITVKVQKQVQCSSKKKQLKGLHAVELLSTKFWVDVQSTLLNYARDAWRKYKHFIRI